MRPSNTSQRLKEIMGARGLRQVDVLMLSEPICAKYKVRLARNDLSQYISGKVEPRQDKLSVLSEALRVSPAWLMGYDVPMNMEISADFTFDVNSLPNTRAIERRRIPVLGEIACGKPMFASENKELYIKLGTDIQVDFCLIAKGDSMIGARINEGDVVFVRKQDMVENGEIAVVLINDEATLKRVFYYPDKGKLILQAENSKYEPLVYIGEELNDIRILGKAIAFQSDVS